MEIIILWILLCIIPTVIANKKGRSGCGFFLLSVFLSPIVGIITALIVEDKIEKSKDRRIKELEQKARKEEENLIPHFIECAKAYCTLQEMCDVLREVFGEYQALAM